MRKVILVVAVVIQRLTRFQETKEHGLLVAFIFIVVVVQERGLVRLVGKLHVLLNGAVGFIVTVNQVFGFLAAAAALVLRPLLPLIVGGTGVASAKARGRRFNACHLCCVCWVLCALLR